jgi:D-methionine transport system substrate-binding protein
MPTLLSRRRLAGIASAVATAACLPASLRAQTSLKPIKVGVVAGPQTPVMEIVKANAAREGLGVQIIEFADLIQPNEALAAGDIDANSFQHVPYLDQQAKDRGYKFTVVGQTLLAPVGLYSKKLKSPNDLPAGGRIAIPNDPSNGGRALVLLQKLGMIRLRPEAGLTASVMTDVVDNPRRIRFVELPAAQLPRVLDDVDAAVINTIFAVPAGLQPGRDSIALEEKDSPYVNVIVVRTAEKDRPEFAWLVAAYRSPEVKKYIEDTFKGAVLTSW